MDEKIQQSYCRPPHKFVPAGDVIWAQFAPEQPKFLEVVPSKATGRRRQGQLYEQKTQKYIQREIDFHNSRSSKEEELTYIKSPWLVFHMAGRAKERHCQPDGIIVDLNTKTITIVEIKLQHISDAWWQVRELYEPVLKFIYGGYNFRALEVTRWLDSATPFPEKFHFASSIFDTASDKFGVHIYYPGRYAR